jgi:hypothetical protein
MTAAQELKAAQAKLKLDQTKWRSEQAELERSIQHGQATLDVLTPKVAKLLQSHATLIGEIKGRS